MLTFSLFDFKTIIKDNDQFLIVGNPPWVNNSTLSSLNSDNVPAKINFKGYKGMDAMTGSSNFDICEYIILQLIASFTEQILRLRCCAKHLLQEMFL